MTTQEFLTGLESRLKGMQPEDVADALTYFDDLITDRAQAEGIPEEEVIAGMESLDQIAAALLEGNQEPQVVPPSADEQEPFEGRRSVHVHGNAVRSLTISAFNVPIRIKASSHEELKLSYTQDRFTSYDYSFDHGELRLVQQPLDLLTTLRLGFLMRRVNPIVLELPSDFAANSEVETRNASIEAEDLSCWGWLKLKSSNASLRLKRIQCLGDLLAQTSNGSIKATKLSGKTITLKTSNGSLEAQELKATGRLQLTTSNARLEVSELIAGDELQLKTSNGTLQVEQLEAPAIRMETSNANVKGSLPGKPEDYSVESRTSNGKDSLRDHRYEGAKRLYARTSNGNIRLEFQP